MSSASEAAGLPIDKMVKVDRKEYESSGKKLSVSQIELTSSDEIMARADEVLAGLASLRAETGTYLAALMATDITTLQSILFLDAASDLYGYIQFNPQRKGIYILKDVLSRKKQLMPALFELVEKAQER